MISEDDIAHMSPAERAALARQLAPMLVEGFFDLTRTRNRRRLFGLALVVACVVLVAWTVLLATSLPDHHRTGEWRLGWTGFDVALLASLATTAWAALRGRQILIFANLVSAVLLVCDAWFDVTLSWGSHEMLGSVLSAVLVELPLAALFIFIAWRVTRFSATQMWLRTGNDGAPPAIWRLPLLGTDLERDTRSSLREEDFPPVG